MTDSHARRQELLALLLEAEGLLDSGAPLAPVRGDRRRAPLSSAQARVWFEQQLDPSSTAANLRAGMRITGPFDAERFQLACQLAAARHEALRTTYHPGSRGGVPEQVVHDELPIRVETEDTHRFAAAERFVQRIADRPFDLEHDAPIRIAIARIAAEDHLLSVIVHHIACDDLTWAVLLPDIAAAYRGDPLPAPPSVQPVDFAVWERARLDGDYFGPALEHWRARLDPAPPRPRLPFDRRRNPLPSPAAGFVEHPLPEGSAERIGDYARRRGVTVFMVLLAGFAALLSRATAEDDIAIAAPTVLREAAQLEGVVGNFLNTLVLRIDLSGDPSFDELLSQVRDTFATDLEHGAVPFDRVVHTLQPPRPAGRHPFADVMFLVHRPMSAGVDFPGAQVQEVALHPGMSGFDLTVTVLDEDAGLLPGAFYRSECFDAETVRDLLGTYGRLLSAAVGEPERRLSSLPLMAAPKQPDPEAAAADTRPASQNSGPATLVEGFDRSVSAHPDRIAVRAEDAELTYRQLDQRAEALAGALAAAGVSPGDRVGLALPRGSALVVAILAILKAGAAYVPVDPSQPEARITTILRGAQIHAAISSPEYASAIPDGVPVLGPDDRAPRAAAGRRPDPDAVAYIIHTSGSTGEPKGVVVSHANLICLFRATQPLFGFGEQDIWTLFHEVAFDFSVWELWGALLHGGRVVVVPKAITRAPEELLRLVQRERVSVLNLTPRAFALFDAADAAGPEPSLPALRLVIFGGDALDPASLQDWFARHPQTPRLVNMYGLTEASVHTTFLELGPQLAATAPGFPIGQPLPELEIQLLDPDGQPVPDGMVGEIQVAGPQVAAGYFGRPELTAERFHRGRYRTGDLARRRRDGSLDYLGRADDQVKVRGYRVEPGECEAALREHVAAAVVVADGDRLIAHVVTAGDFDPTAVRKALASRLPEPMLPAAFVRHHRLPLTANGKLDRRALATAVPAAAPSHPPAPDPIAPDTEAPDALQRAIAEIWAEVLQVPSVDVHDNFFDLGGHSLLLAAIRPRIEEAAAAPVAILDLYTHPSVAALAAYLGGAPTRTPAEPGSDTLSGRAQRQRQALRARREKGRS